MHQWEYLAEVHELGGLAFYLIYAETLDRVFVALMPFLVGEAQHFSALIEVAKDENGWWDWLSALEQVGTWKRRVGRRLVPTVPSLQETGYVLDLIIIGAADWNGHRNH